MKKALNAAKREQKYIIAQKINEFNSRNNAKTKFSKLYEEYWSNREELESQRRMAKRQRVVAESGNEATCSTFEVIINKASSSRISLMIEVLIV
ncbi:hypothetical protein INT48_006422 [Thamnidium elegans]|uniref:Uncharacterized protein n=1 Tax=Thamnidium elegans TaxID=101142 RepID=A0A8H7VSG5_9FUNG|nr:hypothetical protein INT48_006422 [Thamnidium elegans]